MIEYGHYALSISILKNNGHTTTFYYDPYSLSKDLLLKQYIFHDMIDGLVQDYRFSIAIVLSH